LDWVYIDGNHSREAVFNDLMLSWEKTKTGGCIAGDDYFWKDSDRSSSVSDGVRDFVERIGGVPVQVVKDQYIVRKS